MKKKPKKKVSNVVVLLKKKIQSKILIGTQHFSVDASKRNESRETTEEKLWRNQTFSTYVDAVLVIVLVLMMLCTQNLLYFKDARLFYCEYITASMVQFTIYREKENEQFSHFNKKYSL